MAKDYYQTLDVSKSATEGEIKSAYRKLAREWHPDVAKSKPNAETKFKEINEAYQVLGDKQKRKQYDQFGSDAFNKGSGFNQNASGAGFNPFGGGNGSYYQYSSSGGFNSSDFDNIEPSDIFEQVFGFRGFSKQRKGRDLTYGLQIDFVDSIKGVEQTIQVDGKNLKIKLPSGVSEGTKVKFEGYGEKGPKDMPNGDLYILISIKDHPEFVREGFNIHSASTISMKDAALGGKVKIMVVDPKSSTGFSEKELKVPEGTQPNTQFKVKGYGMPHPKGYGRGDHFVTLKLEIPKKLNREQKSALETLF
jgi:DnaJ-class molecular chaperone